MEVMENREKEQKQQEIHPEPSQALLVPLEPFNPIIDITLEHLAAQNQDS